MSRWWILLGAGLLGGCDDGGAPGLALPGDPERGRQAILREGCGSCHRIPGIPGARGSIGPALEELSQRRVLAGRLPHTVENLVRWIRTPQSIDARSAMPDTGLSEQEARDIVAYLYVEN